MMNIGRYLTRQKFPKLHRQAGRIQGKEQRIYYILVDDAIQSAPSLGRLAYTIPSLPDLFGGVAMSTFKNHYASSDPKNENIEF